MNGRVLALSAALLLATACSTTNAVSPAATTVTRAAPAAPTMSPADMATMGHPTAAPAAQSAAAEATSAATTAAAAPVGAPAVNAAATSAPAPDPTATVPNATPTSAPPAPSAAPSAPAASGPTTTVSVDATNVSYKLSRASAPAGTVTFVVHNSGTTIHDLVVLGTSVPQDRIPPDPSQPAKMLMSGLVGQLLNLAPGATGTLTLNLPPGPYVLMCNQPAHYMIGMHVAFTVTAP